MKTITDLLDKFNNTILFIVNHFKGIDNYIIKSDEENINNLLKNSKDKIEFEKAVDEILKNNIDSKEININGKNITISI